MKKYNKPILIEEDVELEDIIAMSIRGSEDGYGDKYDKDEF